MLLLQMLQATQSWLELGVCRVQEPGEGLKGSAKDSAAAAIADTKRESVLLIGTQFSILYTFMYSPA
jgi:hypothetical protein